MTTISVSPEVFSEIWDCDGVVRIEDRDFLDSVIQGRDYMVTTPASTLFLMVTIQAKIWRTHFGSDSVPAWCKVWVELRGEGDEISRSMERRG